MFDDSMKSFLGGWVENISYRTFTLLICLANMVGGFRQRGDMASIINCRLLSWEGETH